MIYIVKDCMTQTRQDNIVVGRTNVELNQTGLLEAKKLAKQLKDVKFDVIYCSPLVRCNQMANIICPDQQVKYDDRITERGFGLLEGKEILNLNNLPLWKINHISRWNCENLTDVRRRAVSFFKEKINYLKLIGKDKNILIITHNAVISCFRAFLEGKPQDKLYNNYFIKNTQVLTYDVNTIKDLKEKD